MARDNHAAGMVKSIFVSLALCFPAYLQGAQLFLVHFEYAGPGPQGSYLLATGKDGLVPLGPIGDGKKLPSVKADGIVEALEKAYPGFAGWITAAEISVDTEKLTASGNVQVFGQVAKAGEQPAALLAESMEAAAPTAFGAVTRIQVIRKQKRLLYNLKNQAHAATKLEPGDIVFVPMKQVFGR